MSEPNLQEVLNRILGDLKSHNPNDQLSAFRELEKTSYSSPAILERLEELAIQGEGMVQKFALGALKLETSQRVASRRSEVSKPSRILILREIDSWENNGLLEHFRAEVLRRRYDFDIYAGIPIKQTVKETPEPIQEQKIEVKKSVAIETPKPVVQPRPSLMQILLSETSVRIYLYLGAFFVIAAAAILAALVEAVRLPVLLAATFAFAAAAVGFKKHLPQPSFAFGIVFSFLLPIDASVIADLFRFFGQPLNLYWAFVFAGLAVVWAFSTWFYESRLFSLASLLAFTLGGTNLVSALAGSNDWITTGIGTSALVGLLGARLLKNWRGQNFAAPIFLTSQAMQGITILSSLSLIAVNLFRSHLPADAWMAHTLTWVLAASFFALSDILASFILFPWLSVASLFLFPWLFLSTFNASRIVIGIGFGIWSALIALGSHIAYRTQGKQARKFYFPLLALSLPLFLITILLGLIEGVEYAFAALLLTAIVYTFIHAMHPRWYVWTTALLAGLCAYFAFFALPFMERANFYIGFQLLLASVLLLLPELFFKGSLTIARSWNWPPVALGVVVTAFNVLVAHIYMIDGNYNVGNAAIILGVYALLVAAYALRFKLPFIGYLATSFTVLASVYALVHFQRDLWLPMLTVLSAVYYFAGFALARNERTKTWSAMLIHSGLGLGTLISLVALASLKVSGGWYALAIGILFIIELFTRRTSYLEVVATALLNITLALLLNDFSVNELAYYVFGSSLVWLASDAILHLSYQGRNAHVATRFVAGVATMLAVIALTTENAIGSSATAICFAIYSAFFAVYAWLYKTPALGYLSSASAATMMFYALDLFKIELWMPFFTGLAVAYYVIGFITRKAHARWSQMFRFSGLGLGSLVSLLALVNLESTGGWYALIVGLLFVAETVATRNGWLEPGIYTALSIASFLILRDFNIREFSYILLVLSLVWLGGDAVFKGVFKRRQLSLPVKLMGSGITALNTLGLLFGPNIEGVVCFGVYTLFFAVYAVSYRQPFLGFASTTSLPLAILFSYKTAAWQGWQFAIVGVAVLYYAVSLFLRNRAAAKGWETTFFFSGLGLGTITALASPLQTGGAENALPIAIAATLFAAEAFARRNVWLAFPANGLYLLSYFTLLLKLNVDEPQYFSIGAALLGLLMHYLLVRAKSNMGAFAMGMGSQLVLLGTTFIQMVSTSLLGFFLVLFVQSLVILVYGILMRSRSLVIAPIGFAVLGTLTVLYSAMKGLSVVLIVGVTGITLLVLGVIAVLMRERLTMLAERFGEWNA